MKSALIFLNGYYDLRYPEFYKQEIMRGLASNQPLICADGGIRLFHSLNQTYGTQLSPSVLIGDLDSFEEASATEIIEQAKKSGTHVVREWIGRVDKDYTDGQLAVAYAIEEYGCHCIIIYGGLPRPGDYETDHFLGNLKLMRFGLRTFRDHCDEADPHNSLLAYTTEIRDPLQTIHFVLSALTLERKGEGLQRVSLVAEHANATVESSVNLRWNLTGLYVDPDLTNTLRNEFVPEADNATIRLAEGSDPVYVIHNWYPTSDVP